MKSEPGILYIIATPIGNLADITYRAVTVLQQVALIAAEDTRHSKPLLQHYGITTPTLPLHDHNEANQVNSLISKLTAGESVALISDAGTPLISDPGYRLVQAAQLAQIQVLPVPGACAAIAALSVAGLATDAFSFLGFLPAKSAARQQTLQAMSQRTETTIFYESTHRIIASLQDMLIVLGDKRKVVIAKELTKTFERVLADELPNLIATLTADPKLQRGEFVILIAGAATTTIPDHLAPEKLLKLLLPEVPLKKAVQLTTAISNAKRNEVYELALRLKS